MCVVLRYRFTPWGMWVEHHIVAAMAFWFLRGDIVTWDKTRRAAYRRWHQGGNPYKLSVFTGLPKLIINNWIAIWSAYDAAFGGK